MVRNNGQAVLIAGGFGSVRPEHDESATDDGFDLKNFDKLPAQDVAVSALSSGLYLRQGGMNAAHVQLLIDAAGSSELPPILVQEDGWRVIDGLHRLEAARLRGDHTIKARFLDCTDSEALVLAMKANSSHGLPLSRADRVAGAKRVLTAHPDWSDRALADITGLSAKTIASLRSRSSDGTRSGGKRLGRDGKRRPVTAGEGRRRAAEYISAHPNAPLRQVARETDVSLGTVHDVSARLRRGVSPERNGHRAAEAAAVRPVGVVTETVTPGPEAGATPLRRKNHIDTPLTWAEVAAKVANDPAIRYTEGGKEFLRWMGLHATDPDRWRQFLNAIPAHWLSVIAPIAESIGKEWSMFAERIKNRQETVR
ncbi:ParB/RepB/Spo0J family partition protein [Actinoallomurus soli]|uniref:ParB/RepB/Spo0J family partition protein n=1 Tax=Actinoallomurus soli TaxID=2952535 RepID=UPI00209314E6|nr:ParB/RepB/Spo0J family partition protein [Actinoallomurus soli]MCO5971439.1 ParB/RepB/Spo0J family partition protein [Actinoallomurus soli]